MLLRRGNDALARRRWDEASDLFSRGFAFAGDRPSFFRNYLIAQSHLVRCGPVAAAALDRADATPNLPEREWKGLIDTVDECRAKRKPAP